MKVDTAELNRSLQTLERAIDAIRDSTASDFPDAIADAFDEVHLALTEVVNVLEDSE